MEHLPARPRELDFQTRLEHVRPPLECLGTSTPITWPRSKKKKKNPTSGESNISRSSFKLNTMKQRPALRSIISTREEQHDNTGIHANPWFSDQSTQMASWQLAYCWIIHSLHQAGKKSSMGPGDSAPPPPGVGAAKQLLTKMWLQSSFLISWVFFFPTNWVAVFICRVFFFPPTSDSKF